MNVDNPRDPDSTLFPVQDAAKRSFDGCIRDLRMNDQPWGTPTRSYSVGVCYQSGEVGTFFTADGGFLVVGE